MKLDGISFSYGKKPILKNFSAVFSAPGSYCLFAPSGSGKSTLLRLIAGLEIPDAGRIVDRPERIGYMFQENRLFPWLTVAENIALALPSQPSRAMLTAVLPFLETVELADSASAYPEELSGGMCRRVALARALAFNGDMLILDEPFTGLDEALRDRIAARIRTAYTDRLLIAVTHDPDDAAQLGATIIPLPMVE